MHTEKEVLSLNLLYNYPVKWDSYRIMRDFVQNFYDAKPYNEWWRYFKFSYDADTSELSMIMEDTGFAYNWLLHLGASSKTSKKDAAGYFGEGFKIAALCALRDKGWTVVMSSRNWSINVIGQEINLDGTAQTELAYELSETEEQDKSMLVLGGVSGEDYSVFRNVLLSFFYPDNLLFGEKIFESDAVAVYKRSDIAVPSDLPVTPGFGDRGAVFVRYQMLGSLPFDGVVALHSYNQEDRERRFLYDYDILKVLYMVAESVDGAAAAWLLEQIRDKWNSCPKKQVDLKTWYYVVCQLIRTLQRYPDEKKKFLERNPNLLYIKRFINKNDIAALNRRKQARAWLRIQPVKYKIVQEQFKLLGVQELEELCEDSGGFVDDRYPTETEWNYINILREICIDVFDGFFADPLDVMCRVVRNNKSGWEGKAELLKRSKKTENDFGMMVRYKLISISLDDRCLRKDNFSEALSVYLHEMAHMFGAEGTRNFTSALTRIIELCVENNERIESYRKRWESDEIR